MDISSFLPPVYHWILCHHFNLSGHCAQAILITLAGLLNFLQFLYLHQNDIIPDLAYILKRNHILFLPPKDSAKAPGAGNNQMGDAAVFRIELQIAHKAQLFTVTDVDDFFFFKSKIRIDHIRNEMSLL